MASELGIPGRFGYFTHFQRSQEVAYWTYAKSLPRRHVFIVLSVCLELEKATRNHLV
jgi:hypothetical protein